MVGLSNEMMLTISSVILSSQVTTQRHCKKMGKVKNSHTILMIDHKIKCYKHMLQTLPSLKTCQNTLVLVLRIEDI